ncbi:unnamed protein product [Parascedosporium putredinis]|uniref:CorA-like transporter domain-containing protein n=1 Tax=Parascedosporium putredinis TaxID=1442378 RepID=A0A9P1MFK1_9PEZI|nr:unnamed protein product [Parascedosporium putredinis]CAI8002519.1 unnamed protein product [Parascedosporium putredinis]
MALPLTRSTPTSSLSQIEGLVERLTQAKPRLLDADNVQVRIETVAPDIDGNFALHQADITDEVVLGAKLREHLAHKGFTFIFLFQEYTWAPVKLSSEALVQIMSVTGADEGFLNIMKEFGAPDDETGTDLPCAYNVQMKHRPNEGRRENENSATFVDFMYVIRYMAGPWKGEDYPWSLRKMGVYHRREGHRSFWIILQPHQNALLVPKSIFEGYLARPHSIHAHISLFTSSLSGWAEHLRFVAMLLNIESQRIRVWRPDDSISISSNSIKKLQFCSELAYKALSNLSSVRENLEEYNARISNLAATIVNTKQTQTMAENTRAMAALARDSKEDQALLVQISRATQKESKMMSFIAVITLIFLPATFITGLFSTGFMTALLSGPDDVLPYSAIQTTLKRNRLSK